MTNKRILLIHGDRLLQQLYREKLEESGFAVDVRVDLQDAEANPTPRTPEVILLDLVHPQGTVADFITALRTQPAMANVPILILPTTLLELANTAIIAGANKVIQSEGSPIASIINAIKVSLGQPELGKASNAALFKAEEFWINSVFSNAIQVINQMRHCLPGLTTTPPERTALRNLWFLAHGFAERALILPTRTLAQFLGAFDLLLQDLYEMPEQLNPSTLRTVGQSLDFLATISNPDTLGRLASPSTAKILVVDDEPSAIQFISAALNLAGLECQSAESPAVALEKLGSGRWDLIFLDIGLPQVDGFGLCTKIRAIENLKTTPIVFITGMATFKNKATACLSGGNDFVGKPFNLCELGVKALTWLYRGQLKMV
jgi:DNA-binding response OmpR family regulator